MIVLLLLLVTVENALDVTQSVGRRRAKFAFLVYRSRNEHTRKKKQQIPNCVQTHKTHTGELLFAYKFSYFYGARRIRIENERREPALHTELKIANKPIKLYRNRCDVKNALRRRRRRWALVNER